MFVYFIDFESLTEEIRQSVLTTWVQFYFYFFYIFLSKADKGQMINFKIWYVVPFWEVGRVVTNAFLHAHEYFYGKLAGHNKVEVTLAYGGEVSVLVWGILGWIGGGGGGGGVFKWDLGVLGFY